MFHLDFRFVIHRNFTSSVKKHVVLGFLSLHLLSPFLQPKKKYHNLRKLPFTTEFLRCLSPLNSKLSLVGRGYSWMGDHLGIASCVDSQNNLELM